MGILPNKILRFMPILGHCCARRDHFKCVWAAVTALAHKENSKEIRINNTTQCQGQIRKNKINVYLLSSINSSKNYIGG